MTTAPGDPQPTGQVDFANTTTGADLGTFTLVGGQAAVSTSALAAGNHKISATFLPDTGFATSNDSLTQTVNRAAITGFSVRWLTDLNLARARIGSRLP